MIKRILKKIDFYLNYRNVGKDAYGNQYYEANKFDKNLGLYRRIVDYRGMAEPSKIPEMWHAWLYHILTEVPTEEQLHKYSWQKDHEANFTGTEHAYYPRGHMLRQAVRVAVSSDYNKWKPRG
jgi:NADH:ubiquinone oxidoreductase subunit